MMYQEEGVRRNTMSYLLKVPEIKKASDEDIISTMQKMSDVLTERELSDPDLDLDQVIRALLADPVFNNPTNIEVPFVISNNLIGLPSVMPKKDASRRVSKGISIIPFVQIPGQQPYRAYREDTTTFVDSMSVNLRGGRSVSIHSVIPGMIVSFHHYNGDGTGFREREAIYATRVSFDGENQIQFEKMSEEDALFNMPLDENL